MADFCSQCSLEIFNEDSFDLIGLSTFEDDMQGMYAVTLCEDCGPCQVDSLGRCVSDDCIKEHGRVKDG